MKKKRFLSMALALAMMLGLLAGCANTGDEPGGAPSDAGTPATTPGDDKEPVEESGVITLGIWPEDTETEAIKVHEESYVPAFNAKHPGVEAKPAFYKYAPDAIAAMEWVQKMVQDKCADDEVRWALDYLEIMGKSPEVTEDACNGWIADAEYRVEKGIPVIPEFPAWVGAAVDEKLKAANDHSNIDMSLWQPYYDFSSEEGALRTEEPGDVQQMYTILNGVLQAICSIMVWSWCMSWRSRR